MVPKETLKNTHTHTHTHTHLPMLKNDTKVA